MRNSKWKRARSEGSDNYKRNGEAEMKSAKKGKKHDRERHLDGPFAHFTISKIGKVEDEMNSNTIFERVMEIPSSYVFKGRNTLGRFFKIANLYTQQNLAQRQNCVWFLTLHAVIRQ